MAELSQRRLWFIGLVLFSLVTEGSCTMAEIIQTCAAEQFTASCPLDSVIVMTKARYGRMNIGRCVKEDIGYLGCGSDVISAMDIMCSGRTECLVRVPDPLLEMARGCSAEVRSYLEASYTCYNVVAPMNLCSDHTPIKLTKPEGYLSSAVALRTECGFHTAPWVLQAKPGQQVQISFVEFNTTEAQFHNMAASSLDCKERAFLMDVAAGRKIKICPRPTRVSDVYVSINNTLEVTIPRRSVIDDSNHFLIHYQFIGCPNREPTAGTRFHRTGTVTATVSCIDSNQAFDLVCREGEWEGEIENCTVPGLVHQEDPKKSSLSGMILVVLIAISVILLCVVVAVFIFCVKRLRRNGSPMYHQRCATHESVFMKSDAQYRQGTLKQLHVEMEPCDYDLANRTMRYKEPPHVIIRNQSSSGHECLLCEEQSREHHSTEDILNSQQQTGKYVVGNSPQQPLQSNLGHSVKESNIENENRLRKQQLMQERDRANTIYGYAKHKQPDTCGPVKVPATTPPCQTYDLDPSSLYPNNYASAQTSKKSREPVYVSPPCVDLLNNTL